MAAVKAVDITNKEESHMNKQLLEAAIKQQWFSALNDRSMLDRHITYVRDGSIYSIRMSQTSDFLSEGKPQVELNVCLADFSKSISQMNDDILDHPGYLKQSQIDDIKAYERRCFDNDDFVNYSIDSLVFDYIVVHYSTEFEEYFEDETDKWWMEFESNIECTGGFDSIEYLSIGHKDVFIVRDDISKSHYINR